MPLLPPCSLTPMWSPACHHPTHLHPVTTEHRYCSEASCHVGRLLVLFLLVRSRCHGNRPAFTVSQSHRYPSYPFMPVAGVIEPWSICDAQCFHLRTISQKLQLHNCVSGWRKEGQQNWFATRSEGSVIAKYPPIGHSSQYVRHTPLCLSL